MQRPKIPPADFELALCPTCGGVLDFSFGLRPCVDCGKQLCQNCRHHYKDFRAPSRCKKCARKSATNPPNSRP